MNEKTLNYLYAAGLVTIVVFAIVMCVMTFGFGSYWWGVILGTVTGFAFGWLALMQFEKRPDFVKA